MSGRLVLAAVVGALVLGCGENPPTPARAPLEGPPDIVLVSIDTLRPDHLGSYGYVRDTSPTIDGLARGGVRFENAVSTTSWTLPAHAALFTGLYDSAHGLIDNGLRLGEGHQTLAEVLHDAGYQTAGFFGGPYLHPVSGLDQGFEHYESCMSPLGDDLSPLQEAERVIRNTGLEATFTDVTGPRTVRAVRRWLGHASARPFFLFVHFWDVHYDFNPPREYVERFDPDYAGSLDASDFPRNKAIHASMDARDRRHLIALYDGEIRFTDEQLRQVLVALEPRGRLENTIVVVTADHGEEFFEHGRKGHRSTLYDESIRVPLVISWPRGLAAHRVVGDQVRLVDVMPTLLSLADVEAPPDLDGRDLGPLLRGDSLEPAPALLELLADGKVLRALRTLDEKSLSLGGVRYLRFDLHADPTEKRPLGRPGPEIAAAREALERATQAALARAARIPGGAAGPAVADPEVLRRLESLGYLD